MTILSTSTHFLQLSPGPSFFPCPTFQNQTINSVPFRKDFHDGSLDLVINILVYQSINKMLPPRNDVLLDDGSILLLGQSGYNHLINTIAFREYYLDNDVHILSLIHI